MGYTVRVKVILLPMYLGVLLRWCSGVDWAGDAQKASIAGCGTGMNVTLSRRRGGWSPLCHQPKGKGRSCDYPTGMGTTMRLAEPGRGGLTPYPPYLPGIMAIAEILLRRCNTPITRHAQGTAAHVARTVQNRPDGFASDHRRGLYLFAHRHGQEGCAPGPSAPACRQTRPERPQRHAEVQWLPGTWQVPRAPSLPRGSDTRQ